MASTLVPLILLGLALKVRIDAYGVIEDRYMLALLAVGGLSAEDKSKLISAVEHLQYRDRDTENCFRNGRPICRSAH